MRAPGPCCGPGEVGGADGVDGEGAGLVGLGGVDRGPRGAVDDEVVPLDAGQALGRVGDVEVAAVHQGDDVPGRAQRGGEVVGEHAAGAGDDDPQRVACDGAHRPSLA